MEISETRFKELIAETYAHALVRGYVVGGAVGITSCLAGILFAWWMS